MKVFVSWSKARSHAVAEAVAAWLPVVIQAVEPWVSSGDIPKGAQSLAEIQKSLSGVEVGLICVTPENQQEKWLNYEAGAIAKTENARACTLLLDMNPADVELPLGAFQHTIVSERADMFQLVKDINDMLPKGLAPEVLKAAFDNSWSDLEAQIQSIPAPDTGAAPKRDMADMVRETLDLVRGMATAAGPVGRSVTFARPRLDERIDPSELARHAPLTSVMVANSNRVDLGWSRPVREGEQESVLASIAARLREGEFVTVAIADTSGLHNEYEVTLNGWRLRTRGHVEVS